MINTVVTDQGSNFVRLFKQKVNNFIDEDIDNTEIVDSKAVDKEIDIITEEIAEIDDFESLCLSDEDDDLIIDEQELKREDGGTIPYLDESDNEDDEEYGFKINLGKYLKKRLVFF